jgi:hypothetical protein
MEALLRGLCAGTHIRREQCVPPCGGFSLRRFLFDPLKHVSEVKPKVLQLQRRHFAQRLGRHFPISHARYVIAQGTSVTIRKGTDPATREVA